jgi:phosphonate transport system ATP-binding protein
VLASPAAAVSIDGLTKSFGRGAPVLDVPALQLMQGEMTALIGASGSGKSTLLRHLNGLVLGDPGCGSITVGGRLVQRGGRPGPQIRHTRAQIGFVFQQFNLVERLPVLTNVLAGALAQMPAWRSTPGWFRQAERRRAMESLDRVGIAHLAHQRASTLSGGQQQRAAIARALTQGARVILADEPIASLDPESSRRVMEILAELNRVDGLTVVVSLHQVEVALQYCQRVVALRAGRVVHDAPAARTSPADLAGIYGSAAPAAVREYA